VVRQVARPASASLLSVVRTSDPKSEAGAGDGSARAPALCSDVSPTTPVEISPSTSSASITGKESTNALTWSGRTSTRSTRDVASPESSCILSSMTAAVIAASLADFRSGMSSRTFSTPSREAFLRSFKSSFLSCSTEMPSRSRTAQTVFRDTPSARAVADMLRPSAAIRTIAAYTPGRSRCSRSPVNSPESARRFSASSISAKKERAGAASSAAVASWIRLAPRFAIMPPATVAAGRSASPRAKPPRPVPGLAPGTQPDNVRAPQTTAPPLLFAGSAPTGPQARQSKTPPATPRPPLCLLLE